MTTHDPYNWWTPAEAATALGVTTDHVRHYIRNGQLAAEQESGRYQIPDWAMQPHLYHKKDFR